MPPNSFSNETCWQLGADVFRHENGQWERLDGTQCDGNSEFLSWMQDDFTRSVIDIYKHVTHEEMSALEATGFVIPGDLQTLNSRKSLPVKILDDASSTILFGITHASPISAQETKNGPRLIRESSRLLRLQDGVAYHPGLNSVTHLPVKVTDLGDMRRPFSLPTLINKTSGHRRIIMLGGDHTATWYALSGLCRQFGKVAVLQIDAHCDFSTPDNAVHDRLNHASVMRYAADYLKVDPLIRYGVRAIEHHKGGFIPSPEDTRIFNLSPNYSHEDLKSRLITLLNGADALAITIDIDGFDPLLAPNVSHPEPGGLDYGQVIALLIAAEAILPPVYIDIVEVAEVTAGQTAKLAGRLLDDIIFLWNGYPHQNIDKD